MVEGAVHHGTSIGGGGDLRRLPRPVRDRLRGLQAPGLRPAAPDETHQQGEAVPAPSRRARRLPAAPAGPHSAIRWDVIHEQYDSMIKYGTAIRVGTASTEAILRRFTRTAGHPQPPSPRPVSLRPPVGGRRRRVGGTGCGTNGQAAEVDGGVGLRQASPDLEESARSPRGDPQGGRDMPWVPGPGRRAHGRTRHQRQ